MVFNQSEDKNLGTSYVIQIIYLLHHLGWKCPHNSAACLEVTDENGGKRYEIQ